MKYLTILDVAKLQGWEEGNEWPDHLPLLGGCYRCGESLAAYNMYPSTWGFVMCSACLCGMGFLTLQHFEQFSVDGPASRQDLHRDWWEEKRKRYGCTEAGSPLFRALWLIRGDVKLDGLELIAFDDHLYYGMGLSKWEPCTIKCNGFYPVRYLFDGLPHSHEIDALAMIEIGKGRCPYLESEIVPLLDGTYDPIYQGA